MTRRYLFLLYIIISLGILILFNGLFNILIYVNDNDELLLEIESLEVEKNNLINIIESNKELSELNNYDFDLIYGRVTLRDIYTFNDLLKINIGSNDGVEVGDTVISHEGFLGVIDSVTKNTSVIKLISNEDFNLSVIINDTYGNYNDYLVTDLTLNSNISVNDLVYTSGLTDIVGNIYVGRIKDVNNSNLERELVIDVVDTNVNYVGIIK